MIKLVTVAQGRMVEGIFFPHHPPPFPRAADLLLSKEASPLPAHMTTDYYINLFS